MGNGFHSVMSDPGFWFSIPLVRLATSSKHMWHERRTAVLFGPAGCCLPCRALCNNFSVDSQYLPCVVLQVKF